MAEEKDKAQSPEPTPSEKREKLEKQVCEMYVNGDVLGAIETLDKAIEVDKKWYHYIYKATWLYDLGKYPKVLDVLKKGFGHFGKYSFWFKYLYADFSYRVPYSAITIDEVKKRIYVLNDLLPYLQEASVIIERDKTSFISDNITEIPTKFAEKIGTTSLDVNNIKSKVLNLMLEVSVSRQGLLTFEAIYTAGTSNNLRFEKLESKVELEKTKLESKITGLESKFESEKTKLDSKLDSEKIKIIELLSIFTAVMSFIIISGTAATRMESFNVAMPILGGLALVLIFFISVVSLLLEKESGWKEIRRKPKFFACVVLGLLILGLAVSTYYISEKKTSTNQDVSPKTSIVSDPNRTS